MADKKPTRKPDDELLTMARLGRQLDALPSDEARRRVLAYLASRHGHVLSPLPALPHAPAQRCHATPLSPAPDGP